MSDSNKKDTKRTHYLLYVVGDVEPTLEGPYPTGDARDQKAIEIRNEEGIDAGGLYMLDVDANGVPTVGAYTGGFLDGEN